MGKSLFDLSCLHPQVSLSSVRSPEVPRVDEAPLQDRRQAQRGRPHSDHPRRFRNHSGFGIISTINSCFTLLHVLLYFLFKAVIVVTF